MTPTILLLGAGGNAGRNFMECIRLEWADARIIAIDQNPYYLAACDADEKELLPRGVSDSTKVEFISKLVERYGVHFIHAQPDPEVEFLVKWQDKFPGKTVGFNALTGALCSDKLAFAEKVAHLQSKSYRIAEWVDCSQRDFWSLRDPNSGKAWIRAKKGAGTKAALPVSSFAQAQHWVDYWVAERGLRPQDFMVATHLPGKNFGVQTLWIDGKLVHLQARERVALFFAALAPSGTSSTPSVAKVVNDSALNDFAVAVIKEIDPRPHGTYNVDIKAAWDGGLVATEINYGRFFTTMDFFAKLGMNSPAAMADWVINRKVHAPMISVLERDVHWIRGLDMEAMMIAPQGLL